jgi:hypothetical protein
MEERGRERKKIVRGDSPEKGTDAERKGDKRKGKEQFGTEFVVMKLSKIIIKTL